MANTVEGQSRTCLSWNGYPVVVLQERDGRTVHFHGVLVGPRGMGHATALRVIDESFNEVVSACPGEWNYDQLLDKLKARGFEEILASEWWEHLAL
jgi:hypothetical protein